MAGAVETLLNYIVNQKLIVIEEKYNQLTTRLPGSEVAIDGDDTQIEAENQPGLADEERRLMGENLPIFADALARAAGVRAQGNGELALRDTNSLHNTMADVLVRYLVRTDLASVRSVEDTAAPALSADPELEAHGLPVEQVHPYSYYFTINWDGLDSAARVAGTSLDAVLREATSGGPA